MRGIGSRANERKEKTTMKKLLLITAVMAAVAANAATFSWKTNAMGKIYEAGSTSTTLASATAYLFDAGKVSQAAVLTAFNAGTAISTLAYADTTSVASGAIANKVFDVPSGYAEGDAFTAYIAIVMDDSIYIGNTVAAETPSTGNKQISLNEKSSSQGALITKYEGFGSAGWYAKSSGGTEPIPEPTSGILLLLGMAGLALRRKRA